MGENPWHRARGGACLERNTQLGNPARYDDSEVHIYRYVWRHSHKGPHRPIPSRTDFQSFLCSQDTSWLTGISVEVFGFFGIFPGFPLEPSNIRSQFSIDDGIPTAVFDPPNDALNRHNVDDVDGSHLLILVYVEGMKIRLTIRGLAVVDGGKHNCSRFDDCMGWKGRQGDHKESLELAV